MMKLNQKSIFIVILVYFVEFQSAFQVLNGECPYIESIEDFDMKRVSFLSSLQVSSILH